MSLREHSADEGDLGMVGKNDPTRGKIPQRISHEKKTPSILCSPFRDEETLDMRRM
mgnify:CR=1 FL=1